MIRVLAGQLWPLKIAAKLVLSRLPISYSRWQRINLFRFGKMDNAEYALRIFRLHASEAFANGLPEDFVALELGPGDSAASALIARVHGAGKAYLLDVGDFARKDLDSYRRVGEHLAREGLLLSPALLNFSDFHEFLALCCAEYRTEGLDSLRALPEESVDFIWSHSVLEHVRKRDFDTTMKETFRVLKTGGRASHSIDLMDHLAKSLNNLRFSERVWESEFMARSGFYTNRLRFSDIQDSMTGAGFTLITARRG